ncbi:response regulator [Arenibaculum sp.]|uniref:response regulator n=1 Tax=Arenibaculum sp. TaxID=2865862 RepID=UPI002E15798D|nr:response regulator [Arenibaculum sp.]
MKRIRLLVADDSQAILDAYAAVLGDVDSYRAALGDFSRTGEGDPSQASGPDGIDVVGVSSGEQSVAAVQCSLASCSPFAAAILDYRMPPGITGVEAAARIRALDPLIRIILISGVADIEPEEMVALVPPADLVSYMRKPVRPVELLRHVGRILGFGECVGR